mmetsp:Transcript_14050/g.46573  ORF Transcript_14050/g.46573 Transcript_14050/m.46573 type:complete len:227 (+) Transcript_14050:154-834(+)
MRLRHATYARVLETTMSVSAPVLVNIRAPRVPVCAFSLIIEAPPDKGGLGRMETLVCASDSIPSTTAVTEYSTSSTLTRTSSSTALYAASTGPLPTALVTRVIASGPVIFTVAVGIPMVPHTTCTSSSRHETISSPAPATLVASATISSSSTPPVFCSATSLNLVNMSFKASPSMGNPSWISFEESACRPECLPITTPTLSSPRKYPIVSGAMISYVFLFLSIPSW